MMINCKRTRGKKVLSFMNKSKTVFTVTLSLADVSRLCILLLA
jgi:hypothetical protein